MEITRYQYKGSSCGKFVNSIYISKLKASSYLNHNLNDSHIPAPNRNKFVLGLFLLIYLLCIFFIIFHWNYFSDVYYFYVSKIIIIVGLFIGSIDLLIDFFVTPNYLVIKNPYYKSDRPIINTRYVWFFWLKIWMVIIGIIAIYLNWVEFYNFLTNNKIMSLLLFVLLLIFLFLINSGFINNFRNTKTKKYIIQVQPYYLFRIILHKYFKFYILLGLIFNFTAVYLARLYNFVNVEWVDNLYFDFLYNISLSWLALNVIVGFIRFVYKLCILYKFGKVNK